MREVAAAERAAKSAIIIASGNNKIRPTGDYPVRHVASAYAQLANLAESGDQRASRTLFHELTTCRVAPRTQDDLDRRIAGLKRKATDDVGLMEGVSELVASLKSDLDLCGGVTDQQLADRAKWNALLAASGDTDARIRFAFVNIPEDPQRVDYYAQLDTYDKTARQYLEQEIEAGNAEALLASSLAYSRPITLGQRPAFPQDDELAYEYLFAFSMVPGNENAELAQLVELERKLSNEQINQAQQAGSELYTRCCTR